MKAADEPIEAPVVGYRLGGPVVIGGPGRSTEAAGLATSAGMGPNRSNLSFLITRPDWASCP
jgi:hypothetical protein